MRWTLVQNLRHYQNFPVFSGYVATRDAEDEMKNFLRDIDIAECLSRRESASRVVIVKWTL
jgi:hypothetical protein